MVAKMLFYILYCGHLQGTDQKTEDYQKLMLPQQGSISVQQMKTFTENYRQSELWSPQPIDSRNNAEETEVRRLEEAENHGLHCEFWFPSDITKYTHKILPTWMPKYDLHKDDTNQQAKMDGEKSLNFSPTHRTRGNWSENWRSGLSYIRMQYLFVQH